MQALLASPDQTPPEAMAPLVAKLRDACTSTIASKIADFGGAVGCFKECAPVIAVGVESFEASATP